MSRHKIQLFAKLTLLLLCPSAFNCTRDGLKTIDNPGGGQICLRTDRGPDLDAGAQWEPCYGMCTTVSASVRRLASSSRLGAQTPWQPFSP